MWEMVHQNNIWYGVKQLSTLEYRKLLEFLMHDFDMPFASLEMFETGITFLTANEIFIDLAQVIFHNWCLVGADFR